MLFLDVVNSADLTIYQADFDAVGMGGGIGQDVFDDALREFAGALILFEDDGDRDTGFNILAIASVWHVIVSSCNCG